MFANVTISSSSPIDFRESKFDNGIKFANQLETSVLLLNLSSLRGDVNIDVWNECGSLGILLINSFIECGNLDQPDDGAVHYNLADATLGDVTLDLPTPDAFDRYLFHRTDFDGFPFVEYRDTLRTHRWKLHCYAREYECDTTDLELTYLKAKQGATAVGDSDDAAEFFI